MLSLVTVTVRDLLGQRIQFRSLAFMACPGKRLLRALPS